MSNRIVVPSLFSLLVLLSACPEKRPPEPLAAATDTETVETASEGEPRRDSSSPTGYYIPLDLDDALHEVDRIFGTRGREQVMSASEFEMVGYHMSFGLWMRNNWGLWAGSRLAKYFNSLGIHHPDDMSGIILDSYWRMVHGVPIDLEGQVRYYKRYWRWWKHL